METKAKKIWIGAGIVTALFGLFYCSCRMENSYLNKADNFYQEAVKYKEAGNYMSAQGSIIKGQAVIKGYYRDQKYDILLAADKADKISKKLKNLQSILEKQ